MTPAFSAAILHADADFAHTVVDALRARDISATRIAAAPSTMEEIGPFDLIIVGQQSFSATEALPIASLAPDILLLGDSSWVPPEQVVATLPHGTDASVVATVVQQIACRRQAEQEHASSRQLLDAITDNLPFPIYAKDAQGRKTYRNKVDGKSSGATKPTDLLGMTDVDLYGPELGADSYADDLRVIESGEPLLNHEELIITPDGTERWLETTKVPLRNGDGTVYGLVGIGLDITERKRAEEAAQEGQQALSSLLAASQALSQSLDISKVFGQFEHSVSLLMPSDSVVVSLYDGDSQTITCGYMSIEGEAVDVADLPAIPLEPEGYGMQSQVIRSGNPLIIDDVDSYMAHTKTAYQVDLDGTVHDRDEAPSDGRRTRSKLMVPMVLGGEITGVVYVASYDLAAYTPEHQAYLQSLADRVASAYHNALLYQTAQEEITRRQALEKRLLFRESTMLEAERIAKTGGWVYDVGLNASFWTRQMYINFGLEPANEPYPYDAHREIVHPDDWERFDAAVKRASTEGIGYDLHLRMVRPSGDIIHLRTMCEVVRDDDGNILRLVGAAQDITDRVEAQEALSAQQALLDEVSTIAKIGGWEMDLATGDATWTQGTYDIVEIPPGERIPGLHEHTSYYLPEYQDMVDKAMRQLIEKDIPLDIVAQLRTHQGTVKWCRAIGRAERVDGKCVRVMGTFQDVTESVVARQALEQSEQRYRAVVEDQTELISRFLADGTITWANETAGQYVDRRADDLVGGNFLAFLSADEQARTRKALDEISVDNPVATVTQQLELPTGETRWLQWRNRALFDETGRITEFQGVGRDVTQEKRAELRLQQSERMMRYIIKHDPNALAVYDTDMRYIAVSDRYLDVFGLTGADIVGKRRLEVFPNAPKDWHEVHMRVLAGGTEGNDNDLFERPDGVVINLRWECIPWYEAEGSIGGSIYYSEDITERSRADRALRESMLRQREVVKAGNVGYWDWDLVTNRVQYSAEWKAQIGYAEDEIGDEFIEWRSRVHPDDLPDALQSIQEAIDERSDSWTTEFRFQHRDGSWRWIVGSASILTDESGEPVRAVGSHVDATDLKRSEEERQQLAQLIDNADSIAVFKDPELRYLSANQAYLKLIGHERLDNIVGKTDAEMFQGKGTPAQIRQYMDNDRKALQLPAGESLAIEERLTGADGQVRYFLTKKFPIYSQASGELRGVSTLATEITERKRAEEALRESETLYRGLLSSLTAGVVVHGPDTSIVIANPAGTRMLGIDEEQIVGKQAMDPAWRFLREDGTEMPLDEYPVNQVLATRQPVDNLVLGISRAQTDDVAWVLVSGFPVMRDAENIERVIVSFVDITERKETEERLRQQQNLLDRIFDILPVGLWLANAQGELYRSNEAGRRIWGQEPLVGQEEYGVFVARRLPSREPIAPEDWALAHTVNEGITVTDEELEIDAFHGQTKTILNYTAPVLNEDDEVEAAVIVNLDITERKKIEEALREREQVLSRAQRVAGLGSWVWRIPEDRLEWTDEMYAIYGLDRDTFDGDHSEIMRAMVHPDDIEVFGSSSGSAIKDGVVRPTEYRIIRPDGEVRHIWAQAGLPQRNAAGEPVYMVGIMQDITERVHAEAALRSSEERYRTLFENMTQGVFYQDRTGSLIDINRAAQEIFGLERDEIIGRTSEHPDWGVVDEWGNFLPGDQHPSMVALREGRPVVDQLLGIINARTQERLWVNVSALPQFRDGGTEPYQVFVTMQDVTGRTLATAALAHREQDLSILTRRQQALLSAIPDIVVEVNAARVHTWVNEAGYRFYGDDTIGRAASEYFVGDQQTYQATQPLIDGREDTIYVESLQRRQDGQERLLAWWCRSLKDEHGNVIGGLSTARDITDERLVEEQLRQSQKIESVGRLAGGVAHDFNNMLQVILGHTEMAKQEALPNSSIITNLDEIKAAAQRSAALTRQLLGFARQQVAAPEVLRVSDHIAETLRMIRRLIGEEISLIWKPGPEQGAVFMDPNQLDQILANLSVNARDAIDGIGEIVIQTQNVDLDLEYCQTHTESTPGAYVAISVTDSGSGMTDEVRQHLFEPFFTTKGTGKGTGLGLATVYGIVKQNGGMINVYSELGLGTTFRIYLPRVAEETPDADESTPEEETVGGAETVLVVEDEPGILRIASMALRQQGYDVVQASSPSQAIEKAALIRHIDLLITDVVMPEMNGRELRDLLRESRPALKTLFMSGYTSDVVVHRGVVEEGVELLHKPFSIRALAARVREILDEQW